MARIYFNCPTLQSIQWNSLLHSFSARQITAGVLCVTTVCLLLFGLVEIFMVGSSGSVNNGKHFHKKPASQTLYHTHVGDSLGPDVQYGIVIDCGSSGSRVYVYFWPPHSGNPSDLLNVQQLMGKDGKPVVLKKTPGLDTFENNPGAASDYIKPLLKYAAQYIPQSQHKETMLFILATAGMRMISTKAQEMIFDDLKRDIAKEFPFVISESNLEVISGKQEGVYAWIAVNYALRRFDHGEEEHPLVAVEVPGETGKRTHIRRRTVGMMDMGGGSMQIAFEVTSKSTVIPKTRLAEFNLGCQNNDLDHTYRIYIHSFLGFGANEARDRYEGSLIQNTDQWNDTSKSATTTATVSAGNFTGTIHTNQHHGRRVISDPCLPPGLIYEAKDEKGHFHYFKGTGDYISCKEAVLPILNLSQPCEQEPCSMNGIHQPNILFSNSEFYGFSEFWYTMQDVYRKGGLYSYETFEQEAKKFCGTKWSLLQTWHQQKLYPQADDARMKLECFKSAWMTNVLHKGLKFPTDYKLLHSVQHINNRDVQWTLGALIHRTRFLPLRNVEKLANGNNMHTKKILAKRKWSLYNSYIVVPCFVVVLFAILLYAKHLRWCSKDIKREPSRSYFDDLNGSTRIESGMKRVPSRSYFDSKDSQVEQGLGSNGFQYV